MLMSLIKLNFFFCLKINASISKSLYASTRNYYSVDINEEKRRSRETDSNHRPKDYQILIFNYSPPLYQLSYREQPGKNHC